MRPIYFEIDLQCHRVVAVLHGFVGPQLQGGISWTPGVSVMNLCDTREPVCGVEPRCAAWHTPIPCNTLVQLDYTPCQAPSNNKRVHLCGRGRFIRGSALGRDAVVRGGVALEDGRRHGAERMRQLKRLRRLRGFVSAMNMMLRINKCGNTEMQYHVFRLSNANFEPSLLTNKSTTRVFSTTIQCMYVRPQTEKGMIDHPTGGGFRVHNC